MSANRGVWNRIWTLLFLSACSAPEGVETFQSAIVNGELSDESDDAVVELYAGTGSSRDHCSASLIAPNVIVTALHCVAQFNTLGRFSCSSSGALTTSTPPDGSIGGPKDPASISVHLGVTASLTPDAVGVRVFGSGTDNICRNDIALVVLDRELDAPIAPVRLERQTRRAELVRTVGYGLTGMSGQIRRHVRHGVTVTDVGTDRDYPRQGLAAPNTFVVTEGPCQGDSGGPALSEETGAVIGVYSVSAGVSCTSDGIRNVFTTLAPFSSLVQQALEYAGHEAVLEPPEPMPEGGSGGEAPEPQGGSGALPNGGTGNITGGIGGASGGRAGAAQGGEPEDPGSGSRDDASCACRLTPSNGSGQGAGALVALALLAFRRRSSRTRVC